MRATDCFVRSSDSLYAELMRIPRRLCPGLSPGRMALCLIMSILSGCGSPTDEHVKPTVPVNGTITLNQKALTSGTIRFLPEGPHDGRSVGSALITEEGEFVASTYTENDGLTPGEYRVEIMEGNPESVNPADMDRVVQTVNTEPQLLTVPGGGLNEFALQLKSAPPATNTAPDKDLLFGL
ncbi:MAG: hypothetical protein KDA85_13535 [Planctomycetaceae bacterium]|nr:hypothetical protein [Planctomycetaceae bacterium]